MTLQKFLLMRGYSEHNLRYMRQFYYEYAQSPDLLDIAKNVRWSTNLLIKLSDCANKSIKLAE